MAKVWDSGIDCALGFWFNWDGFDWSTGIIRHQWCWRSERTGGYSAMHASMSSPADTDHGACLSIFFSIFACAWKFFRWWIALMWGMFPQLLLAKTFWPTRPHLFSNFCNNIMPWNAFSTLLLLYNNTPAQRFNNLNYLIPGYNNHLPEFYMIFAK